MDGCILERPDEAPSARCHASRMGSSASLSVCCYILNCSAFSPSTKMKYKPKAVIVFYICSRYQICSIASTPLQCPLRRSCRCLAKFATASTNTASNQKLYNCHECPNDQRSLTNMFALDCTAAFATCAGRHAQNSGQCTWPRRSLSSTRSPRKSSSIPSILD